MTTVDIIILAVIVIYLVIGLRRGLIMMIVHCVGSIVSFLAAVYAASELAEPVSQAVLVPHLQPMIAESIRQSDGDPATAAQAWESQSEYLQSLLVKAGLSEDALQAAEHPVESLAEAISKAVGHAIAYALVFVVVFLVCTLVLHLVSRSVNLIARLPVIGSFNALLGGLVGAAFALLLCTCVLWALKLFVPAAYSDYGILPPEMMSESKLAGTLVGWNDGVSLFEMIPAE